MADQATAEAPAAPPRAKGPGIIMHDRYRLDPDTPLSDLDLPSAKAYLCEDRREAGRLLFCLICTPGLPTRADALVALKGVETPGILPLVDYGIIDWPPLGQRTTAIIYERPLGGRVADSHTSADFRVSEYELPKLIIEPLSGALLDFQNRGITHRAIRPNNLFFMDAEKTDIVLGDCVTAPPGFDQPLVFEPVERAMSSPAGRGDGDSRDDLYAFGVTLVFMLLGTNPLARMSEDALINTKLEQGTYTTLCGRERVPVPMLEPLRGMLSDDAHERWGPDELELWISGRKLTPIQKKATPKAESGFRFAGHDHVNRRTLARAMTRNVTDAAKELRAIRTLDEKEIAEQNATPKRARGPQHDEGPKLTKSGKLYAWVRRSLKEPDLAELIAGAVESATLKKGTPEGSDDYLVAKVAMMFDPEGPIRYKGVGMMADALGPVTAVEYLRKETFKVPREILALDLGVFWCAAQLKSNPEASAHLKVFGQ
ncbi:MAG: hypothetical protein ACPGNT_08500, partial [Rhodospirillales bacterium]